MYIYIYMCVCVTYKIHKTIVRNKVTLQGSQKCSNVQCSIECSAIR